MYGDSAYAESGYADVPDLGAPIIPEVGVETRQLVFVIEIDVGRLGD